MWMIEMKLNFDQAEIIRHRLHIPDCMAQVFGPSGDDVWGFETDDEAQDKLEGILSEIVTEFPGSGMILKFDLHNPDHKMVMEELVDGNTMDGVVLSMLDQATDEPDHKEGLALRKVLRQIDRKWENAGLSARFNV